MRRWIVPATVAIGLLAASGAGAAALIDGGDVKDSSLTGKDVKNKSLTKRDFRGSVRGPRGFQGPQGAQGAQGDQGIQGVKGDKGDTGTNFVIRESASTDVAAGATGSATAECLPGERASGGGDDVSGPGESGTVVVDSQPTTTTAAIPTGWTVKVVNATGLTTPAPSSVVAKVICAGP